MSKSGHKGDWILWGILLVAIYLLYKSLLNLGYAIATPLTSAADYASGIWDTLSAEGSATSGYLLNTSNDAFASGTALGSDFGAGAGSVLSAFGFSGGGSASADPSSSASDDPTYTQGSFFAPIFNPVLNLMPIYSTTDDTSLLDYNFLSSLGSFNSDGTSGDIPGPGEM
jgi:hypothetical protein